MCKVSIYSNDKGFTLTSSRDISKARKHSIPPRILNINGIKILSPTDPEGGGSWIGISSDLAACLLNHSGYNIMGKKSRGLLLIKLLSKEFEISNITDFVKDYSPFILVLIDFYSNSKYQYIWDGKKFSSLSIIEDQKIFLSTTIYTQKEIDFYNDSFMSLKYADLTPENIYNYHLSKSNLHSSVNQKTTSITQISNIDKTSMRYTDLMNREEHLLSL